VQRAGTMGFPQVIGPASALKSENKIQIINKQVWIDSGMLNGLL